MKNSKKFFILILVVAIIAMSAGYAALSQTLTINGTAKIDSSWDIKFTNITDGTAVGGATNVSAPEYTGTTATFDVSLTSPGDSMTYEITVTNAGTLDAVLDSIDITSSENDAIIYEVTGVQQGTELAASTTNTVTVKVTYNPAVETQPTVLNKTLKVTLEYVQKTE